MSGNWAAYLKKIVSSKMPDEICETDGDKVVAGHIIGILLQLPSSLQANK